MFGHMTNFGDVVILGGEDPKEMSNFGLKSEFFFIFFPNIWPGK